MGFAGNAGSSCRSHHLPKNSFNRNKSRVQPIRKKKSDTVSPRPKVIDNDVIELIDCIDRLCDEGDCNWLSSDSPTPSLLGSGDSQDIWNSDWLELTLHDRFPSVSSLPRGFISPLDKDVGTFLSDSSTIPPNETSLFLNKQCEDADENPLQELVMQPQEIIGCQLKDSLVNCLEWGSYSSFDWPHFVNSPCSPLSAYTGTSSDFDRSDTCLSSFDFSRDDFDFSHKEEPRPKVIDSDVIELIDCIDRFCDEGDCNWLSSDSPTPSLLGSDDSQDIWNSDWLELTLHDRFSSTSSLPRDFISPLDKDVGTFFPDSSTTIHPNEAPLFLNKQCEDAYENILQELVTQPQEIIDLEVKDSSVNCLEWGSYSSFEWMHFVKSPCSPLSAYTGTSSEFDKSDTFGSSFDFDEEDFDLSHEKELGIDIFDSNMTSTTISREDEEIRTVSCSVISADEEDSVKVPVEDYDIDEPLFWPFDYDSYKCLDFKELLSLSPPKERKLLDRSFRESSQAMRQNIQETKRTMTLGLTSQSATCEDERIDLHYATQEIFATLAGSSQSRNDPHNQFISKRKLPKLNVDLSRCQSSFSDLLVQSFEGLQLYNFVVDGVPIEKIVGLTEFIGEESINVDIEGEFDLR